MEQKGLMAHKNDKMIFLMHGKFNIGGSERAVRGVLTALGLDYLCFIFCVFVLP